MATTTTTTWIKWIVSSIFNVIHYHSSGMNPRRTGAGPSSRTGRLNSTSDDDADVTADELDDVVLVGRITWASGFRTATIFFKRFNEKLFYDLICKQRRIFWNEENNFIDILLKLSMGLKVIAIFFFIHNQKWLHKRHPAMVCVDTKFTVSFPTFAMNLSIHPIYFERESYSKNFTYMTKCSPVTTFWNKIYYSS